MATIDKIRTQGKFLVGAGETSNVVEFFDDIAVIVLTLSFPGGSGEAKVQTSSSLREDLENDNAVWVDWPNGLVTVTTQDWAHAPNALRIVNSSVDSNEDVLVEIRGNYSK